MSRKEDIESHTEALLAPILEAVGFELWDVEYVKEGQDMFLRIYIDKPGGITIDDCVDVSRKLSDALDADDPTDDAYTLEVSSPGLGRKLKKDREFEKSLGRDIDIKFYKPVDGSKEITGKLVGYDRETVSIKPPGASPPNAVSYKRSDMASVKLHIDF